MKDERDRTEIPKLDPNWMTEAPGETDPEEARLQEEPAEEELPPEEEPAPPEEPDEANAADEADEADEEPFVEVLTGDRVLQDWDDSDDAEVWSQLPPPGSSRRQAPSPRTQAPPGRQRRSDDRPGRRRRRPASRTARSSRSARSGRATRSESAPRRESGPKSGAPDRSSPRRLDRSERRRPLDQTQKFEVERRRRSNALTRWLRRVDWRIVIPVLLLLLGLALILFGVFWFRNHSNRQAAYHDSDMWSQEEEKETQTLPRYKGDSTEVTVDLISLKNKQEGEDGKKKERKPLSYQKLYKKCAPSVVSVVVKNDQGRGSGSGVVLTKDGYIITCAHVVRNQAQATVSTVAGKEYDAQLVGTDPQTDLALLKVDAEKLTPAEFGQSKDLTVGDQALAIGDPLGPAFKTTLTNGIISAINRDVTLNGYAMTLLQTTAALNSGNSGGPLLNIYGQVVGINNMKMVSTSTTVEGLGFAVPTSTVKEVIETIAIDGGVTRPVLGVTCYGVSKEMAEENGIKPCLVVVSVNRKSDCAKEGVRPGDLITEIDGKRYTTVNKFKKQYKKAKVGQKVTLTLYRPRSDRDAKWTAEHPGQPPERPIEYQSIGQVEVTLIDQQDIQ